MNLNYFNQLGYKTADLSQADWIIKDFQDHCGLVKDGIIGPNTFQHMIKTYPAIWDRFNYLYMIGAIK